MCVHTCIYTHSQNEFIRLSETTAVNILKLKSLLFSILLINIHVYEFIWQIFPLLTCPLAPDILTDTGCYRHQHGTWSQNACDGHGVGTGVAPASGAGVKIPLLHIPHWSLNISSPANTDPEPTHPPMLQGGDLDRVLDSWLQPGSSSLWADI